MNSKSIKETTEKSIAMLIDNYFKEYLHKMAFKIFWVNLWLKDGEFRVELKKWIIY